MGRTRTPGSADVQRCFGLVDECRELGADADAWQAHLVDGARRLVNAQVCIGASFSGFGPKSPGVSLSRHRSGWATSENERTWNEYVGTVPVERTPEFSHLSAATGTITTRVRGDIWDDRDWYRSTTFQDRHRPSGIDHYIMSLYHVRDRGLHNSVWVHRAVGDRAFTSCEVELVQLLHSRIGRLIGTALAMPQEPKFMTLPLRQRQVLAHLLTGLGEKQVAAAMGLSQATVHEYVCAIYRAFGVSARAELMARFIGRSVPAEIRDLARAARPPG